ncbi:UNVERIFIED_CONTAM: hypothetical protein Sangu_2852800 [Sesamum angustifolium]|uniref:Uncharacterized protein n=1 Tax=Sesamum angustifolium TaxID=2727405 RepID=A0AAW2IPW9_9LAMI
MVSDEGLNNIMRTATIDKNGDRKAQTEPRKRSVRGEGLPERASRESWKSSDGETESADKKQLAREVAGQAPRPNAYPE